MTIRRAVNAGSNRAAGGTTTMTTESEVEERPAGQRREARQNGAGGGGPRGPLPPVTPPDLHEQSEEYWRSRTAEERQAYLQQLDGNHHAIVTELSKLEAASVVQFRDVHSRHLRNRRLMIWLTGFLAMAKHRRELRRHARGQSRAEPLGQGRGGVVGYDGWGRVNSVTATLSFTSGPPASFDFSQCAAIRAARPGAL